MTDTPDERRTAQVHFRCLPSEKAALEATAAAAGMDLTAYLLALGLTGKRPRAKATPQYRVMTETAFSGLEDLGARLNGLTRNLNAGREYSPQGMLDTMSALYELVHADPATSGLFAEASGKPFEPYGQPLAFQHYRGLCRVLNNLEQITGVASFDGIPGAADTVRWFRDKWARVVTIEADRQTEGGRA